MNLQQAERALSAYLDADVPAFLWGAPGVGKSDIVRAVSRARGVPLIDFRAVLREPIDLRGLPVADVASGKAIWLEPAELPNADRDGPEGILFMDELNAAPAQMQAACFGLVLDRRVGEYRLPAGWRIVAAGNRQSDRAAAQRMPSALANRFAHLDVEPNVDAWSTWAASAGIPPVVLAFIRFRPNLLHVMDSADLRAFPTPRAWASVAKVAGAADDIRFQLVAGLVGEGAAAEFEGFVRTWRELPAFESIVRDPAGAIVPSGPAAMFAVSAMVARRADMGNFARVLEYANRLPREFEIMAAVDAVRRDPALCETGAFVAWASRNVDVTI